MKVMINGVDVTDKVSITSTGIIDTMGVTVKDGESLTITYPPGPGWVAGDAGEVWDPNDMRNWPASDIIDHFARELAQKRPA